MRYEPNWKYHLMPHAYASRLGITDMTEIMLQSFSYGLGQVMGTVARELGFDGHLGELLQPHLNIEYMTIKLMKLRVKHGSEEDVVSAYNAGSPTKLLSGVYMNEKYVDKVYKNLRELRSLK